MTMTEGEALALKHSALEMERKAAGMLRLANSVLGKDARDREVDASVEVSPAVRMETAIAGANAALAGLSASIDRLFVLAGNVE